MLVVTILMVLGSIPNGAGTMVLLFLVHFLRSTCIPVIIDILYFVSLFSLTSPLLKKNSMQWRTLQFSLHQFCLADLPIPALDALIEK